MSEHWKRYLTGDVWSATTTYAFALSQWRFPFPIFEAFTRHGGSGGRILDVDRGAGIFSIGGRR